PFPWLSMGDMRRVLLVVLAALLAAPLMTAQTARPSSGQAETSGSALDEERLALIDGLVEEAIRNRELPGAVVVAGRGSRVLYRKAFGLRATSPATEPMTLDTIFDVASLTKVVATTTAVMKL